MTEMGGGLATTDLAKPLPISIVRDWSDPFWRLNNLYQVIDEEGHRLPFRLRPVQEEFLKAMWYMNVILKSRQHGFTTAIMYYFLDQALFNSNVRGGIIAHTMEVVEILFRDKIKFAYDNLAEEIKQTRRLIKDTAHELLFSNNSSVRVGLSMRSGTLQYLLITEHGTICAKYPDKAREIKTGALNTVHPGQIGIIESTAKGREGDFYDICTQAQNLQRMGRPLSKMDYKFFFYPWWKDPKNQLDPAGVPIPDKMLAYFNKLWAEDDIRLTPAQKAWYTKKWERQGSDIKQEHPSTPKEAFEAAIEGAYYAEEFKWLRENNRLTKVPHDPGRPVETYWDLGVRASNETAIWFYQTVGREIRVIDYYERSGMGVKHFVDILRGKPYHYSRHVAPHDIKVREWGSISESGVALTRIETARTLGLNLEQEERGEIEDGIQAVKNKLLTCVFDEEKCATGIKALEEYRREWDPAHGCYKSKPLHNWASNGADAFRTFAKAHRFTASMNYQPEQPVSSRGWT
jgi:hypothetical protein